MFLVSLFSLCSNESLKHEMKVSMENPIQIKHHSLHHQNKYLNYCLLLIESIDSINSMSTKMNVYGTSKCISSIGHFWMTEAMIFHSQKLNNSTNKRLKRKKFKRKEVFELTTETNQLNLVFESINQMDFDFFIEITPFYGQF